METLQIPAISFAAMAVSAVLSIGAPIVLFFVVRRRYGKGVLPVLVGGAGFLLFAMILEQILHMVVLRPGADGSTTLGQHPTLYMLYGGLAAGVFEESARFVSFHILKKRCEGFGTALKHGIGHGGIEAVFLGGVSLISGIVLASMFNTMGVEGISALGAPVLDQMQAIAATSPAMLLISGAERLMALGIQISLSVVVYYAVYKPRKLLLFPLAVLLHALVDCPAALYQAGKITNVWAVEGIVLGSMAALVSIAVLIHKRLEPKETA